MNYYSGNFESFFRAATGVKGGPHPYQVHLAPEVIQSRLIHIPTGCGYGGGTFSSTLTQLGPPAPGVLVSSSAAGSKMLRHTGTAD